MWVDAQQNAGGLIGYANGCTVSNCYSTGSVTGSDGGSYVGGLIGNQYVATVTNCYSTGHVAGNSYVGGLTGSQSGPTATNCFWDTLTSGQTSSAGGTGESTALMKTQSTFTGWDFTFVWTINSGVNNGYPILRNILETRGNPLTAPQNLTANAGNGQVMLKWNQNTEGGFLKYRIYLGADSVTMTLKDSSTASISDTTKMITGLTNGTKYYFRISALDSARLESGQSYAASATPAVLNALREYNPDAYTVLLLHMD